MLTSSNGQSIPCPLCKTPILFDTRQLLQGMQFSCPKCTAVVGLANESKEVVQEAMNRFDQLRAKGGGLGTSALAK